MSFQSCSNFWKRFSDDRFVSTNTRPWFFGSKRSLSNCCSSPYSRFDSFLNLEGYNLVVYPTKTRRWGYKIGDRFGPRTYLTANEAKLALFDDFWAATQDEDRLWSSD